MKKYEETRGFQSFWAIWPKKTAKLDALKAWHQMGCEEIAPKIYRAIQTQKDHLWSGSERKFIPNPATWLRAGRWEDEVKVPRAQAPRPELTQTPEVELPPLGATVNRVMMPYIQNRICKRGWNIQGAALDEILRIKERFRKALVEHQPTPEQTEAWLEKLYQQWDEAYEAHKSEG